MNPYIPKFVKILKIENLAKGIKLFRLAYSCDNQPGQFVELFLPHYGEAPMSVCSHSKDYIEVCVRAVGNITRAMHRMHIDEKIGVRGPYGHGYPVSEFKNKHVYLIGGGTGVAPLRSVVHYALKHRQTFASLNMFFGFRTPNDVLFQHELKEWGLMFNLYLTVDHPTKKWRYSCGLITSLIEEQKLINKNSVALVCGPPIMIKFVVKCLLNHGFTDEQIYISMERLMRCGIGKCGHCMIDGLYVCKDGPVFSYDKIRGMETK